MNNETINNPITKESLFSIGEHFYALESLLMDTEGEITDDIDAWLKEYEGKEEDKIDSYCYLIQKFEEIAEEAKRLAERSSSYSTKVKDLKDRLKNYLEFRGRQKIETPRFTVTVCGNGGLSPVKLNEDVLPEHLPDKFTRTFVEPDIQVIREAIFNGDKEAMDIAQVLPRGTHLRIK